MGFKALLLDPAVFTYLILVLFFLNAVRWGVERHWGQVAYWLGALWVTATAAFFMGGPTK